MPRRTMQLNIRLTEQEKSDFELLARKVSNRTGVECSVGEMLRYLVRQEFIRQKGELALQHRGT